MSSSTTKRVGFFREWKTMYQGFRRDFFHTGSLMPSSRYLGWELAANLRGDRPPARILEIGPGTGPVTAQILKCLKPGDQLDVVEINEDFVRALCQRFDVVGPAALQGEPQAFRVLHTPIQNLPGQRCYQHLISGLPFNNFPIRLVREIWQSIHRLAAPGGTFAFFEYIAIREMKMPMVSKEERKRLALVGRYLNRKNAQLQYAARKVWVNIPPAVVHHLRMP